VEPSAARRSAPNVARVLAGRTPREPLHGFPGTRGYLRQPYGSGWALVGDAGFFRDPLTAHGITDALRDSALLARAYVHAGEAGLADYARERDAWAIDMLEVSDAIGSFRWDLESVKPMHRRLSKIMARESEMLAGLHAPGHVGPVGRAVSAA
jgi:flavin-dependent dehydrogenase